MQNVSDQSSREIQNTHFMFNNFFFLNLAFHEVMWEKKCRAGQATDNNMAHAHSLLDT
jgi:hypothetical protein